MKVKYLNFIAIFLLGTVAHGWQGGFKTIAGHVPKSSVARGQHLGRMSQNQKLSLAITLKLKDQDKLAALIARQYDPSDAMYGKFLTPEEFFSSFAPSEEDVVKVVSYLTSQGLVVTHVSPTLIDAEGVSAQVEQAFQVEMHNYISSEGLPAFAPSAEPALPVEIVSVVNSIVGLSHFYNAKHHLVFKDAASPSIGTGHAGGLSASDIRKAYNLNYSGLNGSGQTMALFELDGYNASDVAVYASDAGISPAPQLQNILIDGFSGAAGSGAMEVILDIELMMAVAPGATKIIVYEGPNSDTGLIDTYQRIATDNSAKQISSSWGLNETAAGSSILNSENTIFMQMASQGQSIYSASGDSGAYDDPGAPSTLAVDDPSGQPYMVGVGGTTLSINPDGSFNRETSWGISNPKQGGGGGNSVIWPTPSYQSGLATSANMGSTTKRMLPDVALDAAPSSGYSVYMGGWTVVGGTSAAAPIWAAFTALVNQQRAKSGVATLGFANPLIYTLGKSSNYTRLFHDVNDSSTNLHFPAVTGYDLSTGWGSINGNFLIYHMAPPPAPTDVKAN